MLRWCAYCQEFQGEVAPLDIFTTTHGMCEACKAKGMGQLNFEITNSHRLREIQGLLYEAGKTGDMEAASRIVNRVLADGLRPVDVLVGLITPLLYVIGIEWETSLITIADEHKFTRFCEEVFELLLSKETALDALAPGDSRALVYLMNAKGNSHSLGIRILSLWLRSKGIETRDFQPVPSAEVLVRLAMEERPEAILISVALDWQKAYVLSVAQLMETLPEPKPALIVGGYAIKNHLIEPIDGVVFLETLTGLDELIWELGAGRRLAEV